MKLVTAVLLFGIVFVAFSYGSELIDETIDTFNRLDELLQGRLFTICDGKRLIQAREQQQQRAAVNHEEVRRRYRRNSNRNNRNCQQKKREKIRVPCHNSDPGKEIVKPKPLNPNVAKRADAHLSRTIRLRGTNGTFTTKAIIDKIEEAKTIGNVTSPIEPETSYENGPIGMLFGEKLRNDSNFIATQEAMKSGVMSSELVNQIKDKGLSDGLKELDRVYDDNKPLTGDLLKKAWGMEQTMMAVATQQAIEKNIDFMKKKAAEMAANLDSIQNLQALKRNATEAMQQQLDNTIRQKSNAIELAKEAMNKTLNRLDKAKLIGEQRFSTAVAAINKVSTDTLNFTAEFDANAKLLGDKISDVTSEVRAMKTTADMTLLKLGKKLASGKKILENSQRTVMDIEKDLGRLATSIEEDAGKRIGFIQDKIAAISEKLDSSLNITSEIRARVVAIKTQLEETNAYLNEAAQSVDRKLLQILSKEEQHQLLQSYLQVKNRIKHFESLFEKTISQFNNFGAYGQAEAFRWADSVIYGDASGMSMGECLFRLKNMIEGRSVIFQQGSILDWFLAAAQSMAQTKNGVSTTERIYMDRASRYFITLQITGYTLLTTAHFIRDNKLAMMKTCLAMEDELWETDQLYALYITAASPTLPNKNLDEASIMDIGSELVLDEVSFESSKLKVGDATKGQLVTCALCRGCTPYFPDQSLGIQCNFKDNENGEIVSLPRVNFDHLIEPTTKPHNGSHLQFVAGILRVKDPSNHAICGVFFSQRVDTEAISLGIHICDRRSGEVLGTDDGSNVSTPIPDLILRDGTTDDGSKKEQIEIIDHVMTSFPGLENLGWITEIGLKAVTKRVPGNPPLRVLQMHMASSL